MVGVSLCLVVSSFPLPTDIGEYQLSVTLSSFFMTIKANRGTLGIFMLLMINIFH